MSTINDSQNTNSGLAADITKDKRYQQVEAELRTTYNRLYGDPNKAGITPIEANKRLAHYNNWKDGIKDSRRVEPSLHERVLERLRTSSPDLVANYEAAEAIRVYDRLSDDPALQKIEERIVRNTNSRAQGGSFSQSTVRDIVTRDVMDEFVRKYPEKARAYADKDSRIKEAIENPLFGKNEPETISPSQTFEDKVRSSIGQSRDQNGQHLDGISSTLSAGIAEDPKNTSQVLDARATQALIDEITSQVGTLENLPNIVANHLRDQGITDPTQRTIVTRQLLQKIRQDQGHIAPILNDSTVEEISQLSAENNLTNTPNRNLQEHLADTLDKDFWKQYIPESKRAELQEKILADLRQQTIVSEGRPPDEIIFNHLHNAAVEHAVGNQRVSVAQIASQARVDAARLYAPAYSHQQQIIAREGTNNLAARLAANADSWYALGLSHSPLQEPTNLLTSVTQNHSFQRILGNIAEDRREEAVARGLTPTSLKLYRVGVTSTDIDRQIQSLRNLPSWVPNIDSNPGLAQHLKNLEDYRDKLKYFENVVGSVDGDTLNVHTRFQRRWNYLKRAPGRLDRNGYRYKYAYIHNYAQDKLHALTAPLQVIYRPIDWFYDKVDKYNPFTLVGNQWEKRALNPAKNYIRKRYTDPLKAKLSATALQAAKRLATNKGFLGKLGAKAVTGIIGGGASGGVLAVLSFLSISYDVIKALGGKDFLKKLILYGGAALGLLWAGFLALIKTLGTILYHAAAGAAIGGLLVPGIGAIPGAIIGGGYGMLVNWGIAPSLTLSAITSGLGVVASVVGNFFAGLAAAGGQVIATIGVATGVAGAVAIGGGYLSEATRAQLNTMRIHGDYFPSTVVAIEGVCWPISTGYISQTPEAHLGHNTSTNTAHVAIDIAVATGTPVFSPFSGHVVSAGFNNTGYGNLIVLQITDPEITEQTRGEFGLMFAHLQSMTVRTGDTIAAGQLIGYTDNTGSKTTGEHLHYESVGVDIRRIIPPYTPSMTITDRCPQSGTASPPAEI